MASQSVFDKSAENPFHEIDWYRQNFEAMENRVSDLEREIKLLMECMTLVLTADNIRLARKHNPDGTPKS